MSTADEFAAMFERHSRPVYAYARRHSDVDAAEDVVAETFLIAWRRHDDLPAEPLPWLLVVARNCLANHHRGIGRARRLHDQLVAVDRLASDHPGADLAVANRAAMLNALAALSEVEREAVLLIAWDGLAPRGAALVAGCSERAFNVRLHRARKRLARELDGAELDQAHDSHLEEIR